MGQIRAMDQTGDTKHEWDPGKPAEVEAAREVFTHYVARGYTAHAMQEELAGEIIHAFDPQARVILMRPQMQGG